MDLIGVLHDEKYLGIINRYLDRTYPDGIKSLMLELEPDRHNVTRKVDEMTYEYLLKCMSPKDAREETRYLSEEVNFFSRLEKRYNRKGIRIIYGDRGSDQIAVTKWFLKNRVKIRKFGDWEIRTYDAKNPNPEEHHNIRRNREMMKAVIEERPQVVLLGGYHTDYLKRKFPKAYYVAFRPEDYKILEKMQKEDYSFPLADKIIRLPAWWVPPKLR